MRPATRRSQEPWRSSATAVRGCVLEVQHGACFCHRQLNPRCAARESGLTIAGSCHSGAKRSPGVPRAARPPLPRVACAVEEGPRRAGRSVHKAPAIARSRVSRVPCTTCLLTAWTSVTPQLTDRSPVWSLTRAAALRKRSTQIRRRRLWPEGVGLAAIRLDVDRVRASPPQLHVKASEERPPLRSPREPKVPDRTPASISTKFKAAEFRRRSASPAGGAETYSRDLNISSTQASAPQTRITRRSHSRRCITAAARPLQRPAGPPCSSGRALAFAQSRASGCAVRTIAHHPSCLVASRDRGGDVALVSPGSEPGPSQSISEPVRKRCRLAPEFGEWEVRGDATAETRFHSSARVSLASCRGGFCRKLRRRRSARTASRRQPRDRGR